MEPDVFAEKALAIERHLKRVEEKLPPKLDVFTPNSDASDAVILHLFQAVQIAIDMATSISVRKGLGTPKSYADAFEKLAEAERLPRDLADSLKRAAGFRNTVTHAYESLDMERVYRAAQRGPQELRAFLAAMRTSL